MLATRVIPIILHRGQTIYKGERFDSWRSIGSLRQAIRVHEARGVDELVLLDISGAPAEASFIRDIAAEVFAPVSVGGGVRCLEQFSALIANGADKVVVNTGAVENPALITAAARKFGSQAVVVSIDAGELGEIYAHCGKTCVMDKYSTDWARQVEDRGAGEILLNSVTRDGTLQGYDLDLIESVASAVKIPVVACGGAGELRHFDEALKAGAHAVAAGAIFAFTETIPRDVSKYLRSQGHPVRIAA